MVSIFLNRAASHYRAMGLKNFLLHALLIYWLIGFLTVKRRLRFAFLRRKTRADNGLIVREINGSRMYLDLNDEGLSRDLFLDGVREPFTTEFVKKVIQAGDVVVDIGANLGYYTLLASRLAGPGGRVFALEPVPASFELLKMNVELNKCDNVVLERIAIGAEVKRGSMYLSAERNLSSFNPKMRGRTTVFEELPVDITTLDQFMQGRAYPSLVRMDVEGYETEIIRGMTSILSQKKPLKILMELHSFLIGEAGVEYIVNRLSSFGLAIAHVLVERNPLLVTEPKIIQAVHNVLRKPFGRNDTESFGGSQEEKERLLKRPFCYQVLFER